MIEIPLTQGKVAFIDDEDYELVSQYKWCAVKDGNTYYAATNTSRKNPPRKHIKMHRLILGAKKGQLIDHVNFNGLDNRKENIRFATIGENNHRQTNSRGKSKYFGVCWNKQNNKWVSRIRYNGERLYLGYFSNEVEAAKAYDSSAKNLFGVFARCNFDEQ